jgi:hypothetical protein
LTSRADDPGREEISPWRLEEIRIDDRWSCLVNWDQIAGDCKQFTRNVTQRRAKLTSLLRPSDSEYGI